jgi:hypothetical protein
MLYNSLYIVFSSSNMQDSSNYEADIIFDILFSLSIFMKIYKIYILS